MAIDEPAVGAGPDEYERILADYVQQPTEEALYRVSLLSQGLIESGLGPEDIIALHFEALDRLMHGQPYRERSRVNTEAQQFLLEVMITYGVRFKEYLEIKMRQALQSAEAAAAQGNLDLAKRSLTRQDLERMLGQLDRAREALGRLSRLTADLVESSRDGDPTLTIAPLVLGEVVGQACA